MSHLRLVTPPEPPLDAPASGEAGLAAAAARPLDFASIYDAWFEHVSRWVRALGGPEADREDLAQEVFMVVRRRLRDFDGRNLPGWLYTITAGQVRQHRRRLWFRQVFSRRTVPVDDLPHGDASPAVVLEKKEKQAIVARLLARMSEKRRATFVLYEIEGYTGEEIARIQQVPLNTVWTRLHHARKDFFALVDRQRRSEEADR